jgi:predicted nucleotidyltransferase
MTLTREQQIEALRQAIFGWPGLDLALLFGSVARDKTWAESDVDVAVRGRGVDVLALASTLTLRLGRDVDVLALDDDLPIALQSELLRDAVCLHEAHPGNYAQWRARTLWNVETDGPSLERAQRAWLLRVAAGTAR